MADNETTNLVVYCKRISKLEWLGNELETKVEGRCEFEPFVEKEIGTIKEQLSKKQKKMKWPRLYGRPSVVH